MCCLVEEARKVEIAETATDRTEQVSELFGKWRSVDRCVRVSCVRVESEQLFDSE